MTESKFYGKMRDYEIEKYKQALSLLQYIHISEEAAKRLKHILNICIMQESLPIDSEGDKEKEER